MKQDEAGSTPTAFSFMAAAFRRDVNRAGLAREVLTVLAERARDNGVDHILGVAADSMVIRGTVCEWEEWTGMQFPVSGDYVVPEALNLLHVDRDADDAVYREENLWMQHS